MIFKSYFKWLLYCSFNMAHLREDWTEGCFGSRHLAASLLYHISRRRAGLKLHLITWRNFHSTTNSEVWWRTQKNEEKKKITVDVITTWVCLCNVGGWIISQPFITQPWNSSTLITFNDKNMEKIRSQSRRGVFFWCRLSSLNASHCLFLSKAPLSYWFNNSDSYFSLRFAVWEADFFFNI